MAQPDDTLIGKRDQALFALMLCRGIGQEEVKR